MTVEELISAGKDQVRSNPLLMSAYIERFAEIFGRKPDCAGCTFNNDWQRLINSQSLTLLKTTEMADKTFKLRDQHKIYTYIKVDSKSGTRKPVRTYGNLMNEDFAEQYLSEKDTKILEERKAEFKILPEKFQTIDASDDDYTKLTKDKLHAFAAEKEYPEDEWKSLKKDELVAYLKAKDIDASDDENVNQ